MKLTVHKRDIDEKLATLHSHYGDPKEISVLTTAFLHEVMERLLDGDRVFLEGFGSFKVSMRKGKRAATAILTQGTGRKGESLGPITVSVERKYYVTFKRAAAFRDKFTERFGKQKQENDHGKVRRRSG